MRGRERVSTAVVAEAFLVEGVGEAHHPHPLAAAGAGLLAAGVGYAVATARALVRLDRCWTLGSGAQEVAVW